LYFPYLDFYKYQSYEAVSVMNLKVDWCIYKTAN
jgi:hypothetical protein